MGALPRPDLAPGPARELNDALHELHHRAGWPSLRTLARDAGCSHTTVSHVFSSPKLPTWGVLELLVEAMNGTTSSFHELWLAASATGPNGSAPSAQIAGRRSELVAVRRHLETGAGLMLITGEAGIGKTTVLRAAVESAQTTVLTGHCLPLSSMVPLGPIGGLLQDLWSVDGGERIRVALSENPDFVAAALAPLLPQLGVAVQSGTPDEWSQQRLVVALRSILHTLAPVALVIEDLHWADGATLDFVEQITTRPELPIVGSWRLYDDDTPTMNLDWLSRGRRVATVIDLGPLTRAETAEQLSILLGGDVATLRLDAIHARSHGQPLFTEQLSAHLDDGADLPPILADLLDARLGDLDGLAWQVARTLGVADRPLGVGVVATVIGGDPTGITAAMRMLSDRRLLAERPDHVVALRHPLLAEGVRRRVVPGERQLAHRRLAETLSELEDAAPAEVAAHWGAAGDDTAELSWRVRAAEDATLRSAAGEAAHHWMRALELVPDSGSGDALDMWIPALDSLNQAGHEDEALTLVLDLLKGDMSAEHRFQLGWRAAGYAWSQVGPDQGLDLLDACTSGFDDPPSEAFMVRTVSLRANLLAAAGRQAETIPLLVAAREVARAEGDRATEASILICSVWHHAAAGELEESLAAGREAAVVDPVWPLWREVALGMMLTDALLMHARPAAEVEEAGRKALAIVDEYGLHSTQASLARSNICDALVAGGEVERAAALLPPAVRDSTDYTSWSLRFAAARVDVARGDFYGAGRGLTQEFQNDFQAAVEHAAQVAELDLWAGRPDRVGDRLLSVLERGVSSRAAQFATGALLMLARTAADLAAGSAGREPGRRLAAQAVGLRARLSVDPLGPGPGRRPVPGTRLAATAAWYAELARVDKSDTTDLWLRAANEWDRITRPHDSAYCLWRAAQVALRDGQGTVAARLLKRAAINAREHVPLLAAIRETADGRS